MKNRLVAVLCSLFCGGLLANTEVTWVGGPSGSMEELSNWDPKVIPSAETKNAYTIVFTNSATLSFEGLYLYAGHDTRSGVKVSNASSVSNRVVVPAGVTLRSLNGPEETFILGAPAAETAELIRAGRFKKGAVLYAEPDDVAALKRHIKRRGRPDAFVCSNDAIAAVFKQTLEKAGLAVPKDVLLIGFGDMPVASLMSPPLTTIRQERDKMGVAAFRRLLQCIGNPDIPSNEILFPAPLIVRESTLRSGHTKKKG